MSRVFEPLPDEETRRDRLVVDELNMRCTGSHHRLRYMCTDGSTSPDGDPLPTKPRHRRHLVPPSGYLGPHLTDVAPAHPGLDETTSATFEIASLRASASSPFYGHLHLAQLGLHRRRGSPRQQGAAEQQPPASTRRIGVPKTTISGIRTCVWFASDARFKTKGA